eukprot:TRINITY_DN12051_c0_g2_i1.p1 TRINITY_DN12051_c0_g2~~TRINITY_DN12051_c0_g2_i1.p1  ORF type:complete len:255 (+),score=29.54 TRINITY_DN12051_c0_g2_i1:750-1514(+)
MALEFAANLIASSAGERPTEFCDAEPMSLHQWCTDEQLARSASCLLAAFTFFKAIWEAEQPNDMVSIPESAASVARELSHERYLSSLITHALGVVFGRHEVSFVHQFAVGDNNTHAGLVGGCHSTVISPLRPIVDGESKLNAEDLDETKFTARLSSEFNHLVRQRFGADRSSAPLLPPILNINCARDHIQVNLVIAAQPGDPIVRMSGDDGSRSNNCFIAIRLGSVQLNLNESQLTCSNCSALSKPLTACCTTS